MSNSYEVRLSITYPPRPGLSSSSLFEGLTNRHLSKKEEIGRVLKNGVGEVVIEESLKLMTVVSYKVLSNETLGKIKSKQISVCILSLLISTTKERIPIRHILTFDC